MSTGHRCAYYVPAACLACVRLWLVLQKLIQGLDCAARTSGAGGGYYCESIPDDPNPGTESGGTGTDEGEIQPGGDDSSLIVLVGVAVGILVGVCFPPPSAALLNYHLLAVNGHRTMHLQLVHSVFYCGLAAGCWNLLHLAPEADKETGTGGARNGKARS